jgi:hypothetical protein
MCVVAPTASIAACNIQIGRRGLSAIRHECDTEQIMVAAVHQQRVFGECVYDVTLNNRVKGINWNTAVFMGLLHLGAVVALTVNGKTFQ